MNSKATGRLKVTTITGTANDNEGYIINKPLKECVLTDNKISFIIEADFPAGTFDIECIGTFVEDKFTFSWSIPGEDHSGTAYLKKKEVKK